MIMKKIIITSILIFLFNISFASQGSIRPAENEYRDSIADFYGLRSPKNLTILKIKGYQQTTDYTCGSATVMSLMHYYNLLKDSDLNHTTELSIAHEMQTSPENGTNPTSISKWLGNHGFKIVALGENGNIEMIKYNLKKNRPIIIAWSDWGGHWVIAAGYYESNKKRNTENHDIIFFADPSARFDSEKTINGLTRFNADRFLSMWVDYQYFKPGQIVKGIYIIAIPK